MQIKQKLELQIKNNGNKINFQSHMKYLGVIIDDQLNFQKHVEYITTVCQVREEPRKIV